MRQCVDEVVEHTFAQEILIYSTVLYGNHNFICSTACHYHDSDAYHL
jgi:hypothetical protein